MSYWENDDFNPYEEAQNYYAKFQRGTLSRRGGNMDWINTDNKYLQSEFINELQRLFGPKYKIRVSGCYFSIEEIGKTERIGDDER